MKTKVFIFCLIAVCIQFLTHPLAVESANQKDAVCPELSERVIIGESENVTFKTQGLRLKARIDTGAETSSLGIVNSQVFERDGKKWLKFSVQKPDSEKIVDFEKPIVRIARIKRHGADSVERPVVKLKVSLANIEMEREFTLADRSKYEFPVLIGRNVLKGKYLVDVSQKYAASNSGEPEE